MSHLEFQESLVRSLAELHVSCTKTGSGGKPFSKAINIDHRMRKSCPPSQCVYCTITQQGKYRTTRACSGYKVPLCFHDRDCFVKWHSRDFSEERSKYLSSSHEKTRGRPKGSSVPKGRGKRRSGKWQTLVAKIYTFGTVYFLHIFVLMYVNHINLISGFDIVSVL